MRYLELRDNGLDGRVPRFLGRLDQLSIPTLAGNSLGGRIPPEIGQLGELRDLYLDRNELSGPLPPEMGGTAGLRALGISGNDLSGPLPETFARLTLDRFYFAGTHLCIPRRRGAWNGSIRETEDDPLRCFPETADRQALAALYRATGGPGWDESENWLSELPLNTCSGVRTDEDGDVAELVLSDNNLRSPLPGKTGDLPHLEFLWLHGNAISGTIPPEIGGLVSADTLYLSRNNLSGPSVAASAALAGSGVYGLVQVGGCRAALATGGDPPLVPSRPDNRSLATVRDRRVSAGRRLDRPLAPEFPGTSIPHAYRRRRGGCGASVGRPPTALRRSGLAGPLQPWRVTLVRRSGL